MNIYLAVVSHNHADMIINLDSLSKLSNKFKVILKNNASNDSDKLKKYCSQHNIYYLDESYGLGFGANNNYIFNYCRNHLNMRNDDYFILINPDVIISKESIEKLIFIMQENMIDLSGISLYKDDKYTVRDLSIRKYPTFITFLRSLIGNGISYKDITKCYKEPYIDMEWAAGSFIAFRTDVYASLQGFNENYFMYCEDIDICYRAKKQGFNLKYIPCIQAIHNAQHNNRKLLSRHFFWHLFSALKFLYSKNFKLPMKSSLK